MTPQDVDAVVCTMNSISSIEQCLTSLRETEVGSIIVVDARSTDGSREIAEALADTVLVDPGIGLGNARNVGIAETTRPLILNIGSDNVMPPAQLQIMINTLESGDYAGVSAQTTIPGTSYLARGLNFWRAGRFRPGPASIIGTPTLMRGELLRATPFDLSARFSDDSELCERWTRDTGATFAISPAHVREVGKTSWNEVKVRAEMYGTSDYEIFSKGRKSGWSLPRKVRSLSHPLRSDLFEPIKHLTPRDGLQAAPFLLAFTTLRYYYWGKSVKSNAL